MRTSTAATGGILAMILTGSSVGVLAATATLPVFAVQASRYAIAAVVVAGIVVGRARRDRVRMPRPSLRQALWALAGAGTGLVGFNLLMLLGVRHAEPAVLGSAVACIPLVLAVAAPLGAGRTPSRRLVAGAVVVSAGAVLVTGWGRTDLVGVLCAAGLIGCEASFTLCAARVVPQVGAFAYTVWTCAIAAVAFGVLSIATEHPDVAALAGTVVPVLYLGLAVTALAFVLWFTAVGRLGADRAGLCAGVSAPAAVLTGWALGSPLPGATVWAGIGLVIAGLAIGFGSGRTADGVGARGASVRRPGLEREAPSSPAGRGGSAGARETRSASRLSSAP